MGEVFSPRSWSKHISNRSTLAKVTFTRSADDLVFKPRDFMIMTKYQVWSGLVKCKQTHQT